MPGRFYTFGPFQVDAVKRQLTRDGMAVPLPAKAFDILVLLLQRRPQVVEKNDILKEVWRGTIVEENNLARNISTLRKILGDSPGHYIVTVPGRGYEFAADVEEPDTPVRQVTGRPAAERRPAAFGARSRVAAAIAATIAVLAAAYAVQQTDEPTRASIATDIWQLTFASGWQGQPTWSPDGRMVAFASDRSGNLDIWVQALDGGSPIQVTSSPAHDWQPDWSIDGRLVYRSERGGGVLVVMPALGGPERQVATFGYLPRWSPDGTRILFQRSNVHGRVATAREMYTVALDGEPPRPIVPDFLDRFATFAAAWHPDSRRVSIWGAHLTDGLSFWTVRLDGGAAVKSGMSDIVRAGFGEAGPSLTDTDGAPMPFIWAPSGTALYFEGMSRGVRNVWRIGTDAATLQWVSGPERLTTSADLNQGIALSPDGSTLAFAVRDERIRLWSFAVDPRSGRLLDAGEPITANTVDALTPVLSRDGTRLVYATERGGSQELWERSLADGRERLVVAGDGYRRVSPVWSHDNTHLMYLRTKRAAGGTTDRQVVVVPAGGGAEQALRTPVAVARLFDWSADGAWILAAVPQKDTRGFELTLLAASGPGSADVRVLAAGPNDSLWKARFSNDARWVGYVGSTGPGRSAIYAVPVNGGERVAVTSGEHFDDRPRWSADGRVVYFLSTRSGFLNVWGRRFDPSPGQPLGEPFAVTALDSPARMIPPRMVQVGVAISRDRLILPITEASGNVWILDGVDR